jgi:hypothetical protein
VDVQTGGLNAEKKCRHWADGENFSLDITFNRTMLQGATYFSDFKIVRHFQEAQIASGCSQE